MTGYSDDLEAVLKRAEPVARRFEAAGFSFYLVGGVVRDYFLGRSSPGQDLDATTDARPDAIRSLLAELADELWMQGERFGTVGCVIGGQRYEITTHRTESYQRDSRRPEVVFGDDVNEDLARRDFTVNAMAIDMADRSLVDPFGGRADLDAGVLRTPLEPEVSFGEDPLRILRAARFAASCALSAVPELVAAMSAEAGRLQIVSAERVRDELQKLLLLDDPGAGLRLIDVSGVGVMVPVVGAVDRWESAAGRVRAVQQDPAMRWAAMLSMHPAALEHSGRPAPDLGLRALKFSGATVREVEWFLGDGCALSATDLASLPDSRFRELARRRPAGRRLEDLLVFVSGLRLGDGLPLDDVDAALAGLARLRVREPDLDDPVPTFDGLEVADLLGIKPGPELGTAMDFLAELRVARGPLDRDVAAGLLRDWWSSLPRP